VSVVAVVRISKVLTVVKSYCSCFGVGGFPRCDVTALTLPRLPTDGNREKEHCFILRVSVIAQALAVLFGGLALIALATGAMRWVRPR